LYFGHGDGQSCFSHGDIEKLVDKSSSPLLLGSRASIILMGCNSGALKSVWGKRILFEPHGIALSYLCAGAPCVVGNLWDVTDKDIGFLFPYSKEYIKLRRILNLRNAQYFCEMPAN
jgi:separase